MKCTNEQLQDIACDSEWHDLGTLPSMGKPYKDMPKLYIKRFRLAELRLLSKAAELKEISHLMRAVDNVISYEASSLTIEDFYYVLLWLRINSMPKTPYTVEWKCDQPYFTDKETGKALLYTDPDWPSVEDLREKYNVAECGTENTSVLHNSDVDVLQHPDDFELPEHLDYPRMCIYEERAAAIQDPEWTLLAPAIQWMPGATWAEKVKAAEDNPDWISEALEINKEIVYGVREKLAFFCRKCRIDHQTTLKLDALSFFQ